jgi:hypothetical protein
MSADSLTAQHLERRGREVSTAAQGPGARAHHDPFMESVRKVQWRYEFVNALLLAVAYLNSPSAAARLVEQLYRWMREETKGKQPEQSKYGSFTIITERTHRPHTHRVWNVFTTVQPSDHA